MQLVFESTPARWGGAVPRRLLDTWWYPASMACDGDRRAGVGLLFAAAVPHQLQHHRCHQQEEVKPYYPIHP